jgi:hypothetical protein
LHQFLSAKIKKSFSNTYQKFDNYFLREQNAPSKLKEEEEKMNATTMEQMERITPTRVSWITMEERATQLKMKSDLHPLRCEHQATPAPRRQIPDFLSQFLLLARPQQV